MGRGGRLSAATATPTSIRAASGGRAELLGDAQYEVLTATAAARYTYGGAAYGIALQTIIAQTPVMAIPMPHGGARWLIVCPRCQRRAARLYGRYLPISRAVLYACRACWGLRYQSQYAGRRLDAHPDYLQAAIRRQVERTPCEPHGYLPVPARRQMAIYTHRRRMRRMERAHATLTARAALAHLAQRSATLTATTVISNSRSPV